MRLRTIAAGLLLAVAIAPTAMAAPKPAPVAAPTPVGGSGSTVSPQFICQIWPSFPLCHR